MHQKEDVKNLIEKMEKAPAAAYMMKMESVFKIAVSGMRTTLAELLPDDIWAATSETAEERQLPPEMATKVGKAFMQVVKDIRKGGRYDPREAAEQTMKAALATWYPKVTLPYINLAMEQILKRPELQEVLAAAAEVPSSLSLTSTVKSTFITYASFQILSEHIPGFAPTKNKEHMKLWDDVIDELEAKWNAEPTE